MNTKQGDIRAKQIDKHKIKKRALKENDSEDSDNSSKPVHIFRLASYNLLSQELLERNSYLYSNCDQNHLDWKYRQEKLWNEIKFFNAEVFDFLAIFETFSIKKEILSN